MAPKRAAKKAAPPPPPPPPAESSDDETQSRSRSEDSEDQEVLAESPIPAPTPVLNNMPAPAHKGDESESSDEEDEEEEPAPAAPAVPKNQPPPPQKKVDSDASGSDEEEEDGDEEEEEEEEEEPTRAAPPSAPKKQPPQPQKQEDSDTSGDEDEEDEEAPPPPEPAPKKVAEVPKPPAAAETKKPGPFERMWSTNDDVRILEVLAAHQKQHGTLPQPEALVDVLAGKLDKPSYGSKELQNKVKSLRTRYLILSKRGDLPSKDHDRRVLDLSKLVWTSDTTSPVDAAAANAVNGHEPKGFQEMCELYPHLAEEVKGLEAAHPGMCKREFGKMDDDKARAMDQKIKKQRVMQIKVEMRHADLVKEVTKALVDLVDS
ncbi:hypothetical protein ACQ4PT_070534 [Festuca glaucescens]